MGLILNSTQLKVFKCLKSNDDYPKDRCCNFLSRKSGVTYCYVHRFIKSLVDKKFLFVEKTGRIREITWTKKGMELRQKVLEIEKLLNSQN